MDSNFSIVFFSYYINFQDIQHRPSKQFWNMMPTSLLSLTDRFQTLIMIKLLLLLIFVHLPNPRWLSFSFENEICHWRLNLVLFDWLISKLSVISFWLEGGCYWFLSNWVIQDGQHWSSKINIMNYAIPLRALCLYCHFTNSFLTWISF